MTSHTSADAVIDFYNFTIAMIREPMNSPKIIAY